MTAAERRRRRLLPALAVLAIALAGVVVVLSPGRHGAQRLVPGGAPGGGRFDPLGYRPALQADFERRAADGLAHVLYAKSPGGVVATAQRVARFRPLVERAAARAKFDPNTLEGIVFLESAGRPDVQASNDPAAAAGLTQILAETGQNLLGMKIDVRRSARLTRSILRGRRVAARQAARRRVDERFDPAKALAATARYLVFARSKLHRDDLAAVSYHMGVGNLQQALAAYGNDDIPYAQLYFDSSPLHHPEAWAKLASLGDDSSTYLWRLHAAERIMATWRRDPAALARTAVLQGNKASSEEVLHPEATTPVFGDPGALDRARAAGAIVPLPAALLQSHGVRIDATMGSLAARLHRPRSFYRGLRPEALALLLYLGTGTREIGKSGSLDVTSTVRDRQYQHLLIGRTIEATHKYSLHTTGWAFDIARQYTSRAQALAFQFMLDRLTALDFIAWVREPGAIHVTVGAGARGLLGLLGQPQAP